MQIPREHVDHLKTYHHHQTTLGDVVVSYVCSRDANYVVKFTASAQACMNTNQRTISEIVMHIGALRM